LTFEDAEEEWKYVIVFHLRYKAERFKLYCYSRRKPANSYFENIECKNN
jgi:hypothetical protein